MAKSLLYASLLTAIFEKSAVGRETFLLGGNVGVGNCTFPQTGVHQERAKYGSGFIWSFLKLFDGVFISFFSHFPDL